MRIFTASVIVAALSLGTPAFVQAQGTAPSQSEAQNPPAQSGTVIRTIQVVDVKDLQPAVRSKLDDQRLMHAGGSGATAHGTSKRALPSGALIRTER